MLIGPEDFIELPECMVIAKAHVVFVGPNPDKNKSLSVGTAGWILMLVGGVQFGLNDGMYAKVYKELMNKEP